VVSRSVTSRVHRSSVALVTTPSSLSPSPSSTPVIVRRSIHSASILAADTPRPTETAETTEASETAEPSEVAEAVPPLPPPSPASVFAAASTVAAPVLVPGPNVTPGSTPVVILLQEEDIAALEAGKVEVRLQNTLKALQLSDPGDSSKHTLPAHVLTTLTRSQQGLVWHHTAEYRLLLVRVPAKADQSVPQFNQTLRSATHKWVSAVRSLNEESRAVRVICPSYFTPPRSISTHSPLSRELHWLDRMVRVSMLSNHHWRAHLSDPTLASRHLRSLHSMEFIDLSGDGKHQQRATVMADAALAARSTIVAREMGQERGDIVTPSFMEELTRMVAEKNGIKMSVVSHTELLNSGYHLLEAVGRGATDKEQARLVILDYDGRAAAEAGVAAAAAAAAEGGIVDSKTSGVAPTTAATSTKPPPTIEGTIALVGKGITFDTGGLLIKGRGNMEGMHMDMCGAGAILAAMHGIASLRLPVHVVAVLAFAENAVGPKSFKPGAILPSAIGSVEVQDTDAEGRLALADALTYVQRNYAPHLIIDMATLTGASVVALGEHRAALFTNFPALQKDLLRAGEQVAEKLTHMPHNDEEYLDAIKSTYADIKNVSTDRKAGACVAAAFLQKFVPPNLPYSHIDIAGPAMLSKAKEWKCEGATGFGAQLLVQFVTNIVRAEEYENM